MAKLQNPNSKTSPLNLTNLGSGLKTAGINVTQTIGDQNSGIAADNATKENVVDHLRGSLAPQAKGNAANLEDLQTVAEGLVIKGTKYEGDLAQIGKSVDCKRKLGETVIILGGVTDESELSTENNIGVLSDGTSTLNLRLAKELKGLTSVTIGKSVLNDDGLAVGNAKGDQKAVYNADGIKFTNGSGGTLTAPSITKDGLHAASKVIDYVGSGLGASVNDAIKDRLAGTTATPEQKSQAQETVLNAPKEDANKNNAINVGDLGTVVNAVDNKFQSALDKVKSSGFSVSDGTVTKTQKLGEQLSFVSEDGIKTTVAEGAKLGENTVTIAFDPTQKLKTNAAEIGGAGKDGEKKDGSLTVKDSAGTDGVSITAENGDGKIALNGKDGADAFGTEITVTKDATKNHWMGKVMIHA